AVACARAGGGPGGTGGDGTVRQLLGPMFDYRHRVTAGDLACHAGCPDTGAASVLVTGASGLIGSALVPFFTTGGHRVVRLARSTGDGPELTPGVNWDPAARPHAGAGALPASRVEGPRFLGEPLARLARPPRVLLSASAIGFYGDRGDQPCDESAARGGGFLADVCEAWENATAPARAAGIRVVLLRIGVVLSPRGGALGTMLPAFRLGAGGVVGGGMQWVSWIGIDDVLGAIHHALVTEGIAGPLNVVSPHPVTNRELPSTLAAVLGRPAWLPVPAAGIRLALGAVADETVLASPEVVAGSLLRSGYRFRTPALEATLRHLLGR